MKKAFTLFLALALGFGLKAQCPYTEARDFTATDIHGNEIHLFDILDDGQYVLIDFFFTTCSGCIQSIPYMVQSYPLFGCNQHDVFYIEVDYGDSESQCQNWVNTYGVEYPTIAGASGGTGICSQYGINAFPTVILIAPNHQIVIQDLWPINNVQNIVTALEAQGVEQHECGEVPAECDAPANLTALQEGEGIVLAWDAVATAQSYNVYRNNELLANVTENAYTDVDLTYLTEYCYTVASVCQEDLESDHSNEACATYYAETLTFSVDTVYIVNEGCYIVPGEITITNMNFEAVQILEYTSDEFTIQCHAGEDPYYGNDIAGLFIAPSDSLHVYVSAYEMGENGLYMGTMHLITSIGDYEITIVYEEMVGVEESQSNHCSLFPNPASDFVTLKGENLGTVSVFNALGQKVDEFEANGNELHFGTDHYGNGVYYIKAGETVMKLVVKH